MHENIKYPLISIAYPGTNVKQKRLSVQNKSNIEDRSAGSILYDLNSIFFRQHLPAVALMPLPYPGVMLSESG